MARSQSSIFSYSRPSAPSARVSSRVEREDVVVGLDRRDRRPCSSSRRPGPSARRARRARAGSLTALMCRRSVSTSSAERRSCRYSRSSVLQRRLVPIIDEEDLLERLPGALGLAELLLPRRRHALVERDALVVGAGDVELLLEDVEVLLHLRRSSRTAARAPSAPRCSADRPSRISL